MGLFKTKHDITDIYGVKNKTGSVFEQKDYAAPESGRRHSGYYHKYFRGYTEIRKQTESGKLVIERYYTRPWLVSALSGGKYWLIRLLYAVLTAFSAGLFIFGLTRKVPGNYSWYVAVPGYSSIVLLVLLIAAVVGYIFVEKKMTLWAHASSTSKVKRFSIAVSVGQTATAIVLALFALGTKKFVLESLLCSLLLVLAALFSGALYFIEQKVPYKEVPNETQLPMGDTYEIW